MDSGTSSSSSIGPPGAQPLFGGSTVTPQPSPTARGGGRRLLTLVGVAVALAVAALLALGLRDGSSGGSALSPIAAAAERTSNVSGGRFAGTGYATASGIEMTMSLQGVYNAEEDRSSMRMEVQSAAAPQVTQMMNPFVGVQDGLTMYMYSPIFAAGLPDGASWMKIDMSEFDGAPEGSPPVNSMDAQAVLGQLELVSDDARAVGKEVIRGVPTTHFAATIDPELQAEQLREAGDDLGAEVIERQGGAATVGVWIDEKNLVRRVAMTIPFELVGGSGSSMSMTMDFFDFGITPEIGVPAEEETFDATELGQQALEGALGES